MICNYGCNSNAHYQLKNGKWCCSKSHNSCEEVKRKNRESNIGKTISEETRLKFKSRKHGSGMLGKTHSKETIQKYKEQRLGKNNPRYGAKLSKEHIEKIRLSILRFQGENNPMFGKKHSLESKLKIGLKSKEKFLDPTYLEKAKKFRFPDSSPNKLETILINLFSRLNLNYKFTGDKSFWIDGKNPDFVDYNNKKVIEFFGDYFHDENFRKDGISNEVHEKKKIEHYNKNNYKCLVIWENELSNIDKLTTKILSF